MTMTRSEVYRRYKELSVKYRRKQAKSWNSSGCTLIWLNERCAYLDTKYGKPKPKPEPEPKYEPDDQTLGAHERWMLAIDRWIYGETVQIRSDAKILMTEMMNLQAEERQREAEQRQRETEQRARETEQRARTREAEAKAEEKRRREWWEQWEADEERREEEERQQKREPQAPERKVFRSDLAILGLTEADRGNKSAIKKAYRRLALRWHPDKSTGNEDAFKRLVNAYEALMKR
jgi:hypothetical protein